MNMKNFLNLTLSIGLFASAGLTYANTPAVESSTFTSWAHTAYDYAIATPFSWVTQNPAPVVAAAVLTGICYKLYTAYTAKKTCNFASNFDRSAADKASIQRSKETDEEAMRKNEAYKQELIAKAKPRISASFVRSAQQQYELFGPSMPKNYEAEQPTALVRFMPEKTAETLRCMKGVMAALKPGGHVRFFINKDVAGHIMNSAIATEHFSCEDGVWKVRTFNGECVQISKIDKDRSRYPVVLAKATTSPRNRSSKKALLAPVEEEEPAILAEKNPREVLHVAYLLYGIYWLQYDEGEGYAEFELMLQQAHIIADNVQKVCQDRRLEGQIRIIKSIPTIKNPSHAVQINSAVNSIKATLASQGMQVLSLAIAK